MQRKSKVRTITMTAMFAAIATILMYFELPLPFMPPFLKLDLSSVPVLIGAFLFGPVPALIMAFIKAAIHTLSSTSGGVGQLADFIITTAFAVSAGTVYKFNKTRKGAIAGLLVGIAAITVAGAFANKFLLIPFYASFMPIDAIVSACNAVNPYITSIDTYILFGAVPFNLFKGIVVSLVTFASYKKLSRVLKTENMMPADSGAKASV